MAIAYDTLYFSDFSYVDGTLPADFVSLSSGTIVSEQLSGTMRLAANSLFSSANYSVRATKYMDGDHDGTYGEFYLYGRMNSGNTNRYEVHAQGNMDNDASGDGGGTISVELRSVVSGTPTVIGSNYSATAFTGLILLMDGTSISVTDEANNVIISAVTSSTVTATGYAGAGSVAASTGNNVDNFIVKGLAVGSVAGSTPSGNIIPSQVVAFWPLGDLPNSATFKDDSGRGNVLTPYQNINSCTARFCIGRNSAPVLGASYPQQTLGALKGWGTWNRILTSGEKAALYGKEYWPFSTTTSLQDALAYYLLDEASSSTTYADATGRGNTLTHGGAAATTQVTGPAGGGDKGTKLVADCYLYRNSPGTDLQSNQSTRTVAGWFNLTSKPSGSLAQQIFWGQINNDILQSGINIGYDPTADRVVADNDAGDNRDLNQGAFVIENVFGSPSLSTWYFIIYEFDVANNQVTLSVNNGTPTTITPRLQPTSVAGKIGRGSQFRLNPSLNFASRISGWDYDLTSYPVSGNCNLEGPAYTADLAFGNNSKTVFGWFKLASASTAQTLGGYFNAAFLGGIPYFGNSIPVNDSDWIIQQASNKLYFVFGSSADKYITVNLTDTASYHLVVAWYDKGQDKIFMDVDHGALTANLAGPFKPGWSSRKLRLGSDTSTYGYQFTGILDSWGIANGVPTSQDLATLWNNGVGWAGPKALTQGSNHFFNQAIRRAGNW